MMIIDRRVLAVAITIVSHFLEEIVVALLSKLSLFAATLSALIRLCFLTDQER